MSTLKRTRSAPLQFSGQLRKLVTVAPGVPIQINEQCLLTFYRDAVDTGEMLRAELLYRDHHASNRHALPYWCYLPDGYAADLFPFAPIYAFVRRDDFQVPGYGPHLVLEFVDFGSPVECALNRIQVAA